jgi:hypothetical protein
MVVCQKKLDLVDGEIDIAWDGGSSMNCMAQEKRHVFRMGHAYFIQTD